MSDGLPTLLGYLELGLFFVADAVYANTLCVLKYAHPELEECAPHDLPDVDTTALWQRVASASAALVRRVQQHYNNDSSRWHTTASRGDEYATAAAAAACEYAPLATHDNDHVTHAATALSGDTPRHEDDDYLQQSHHYHPLHTLAVACTVAAPLLLVLQLLLPGTFAWTRMHVPVWLSYLFVVPGMAATGLYVMRVVHSSRSVGIGSSSSGGGNDGSAHAAAMVGVYGVADVTKTQWLAMTWFRVDFVFIMAIVALLGLGMWLVACCMAVAAAYSTHRVMYLERQLLRVQKRTQLVREDVDVAAVHVPGSAESRRATGASDGYSALAAAPPPSS